MLIVADRLLTKIRLRLQDMQAVKLSDYELLSALNDARSMLWIALAENFSTIPQRKAELTMTDGAAPLPEGYYSLVALPQGARVVGETVESDDGKTEIIYNAVPEQVSSSSEEISVPSSLVLDTVEIAAFIAGGDTGGAVNTAMASARRVSQKREYSKLPDWKHFS